MHVSRVRERLVVVLAALVASTLLLVPLANAATPGERNGLPLGPADLTEQRSTEQLAPGVTLTQITRGAADPGDVWTVTGAWEDSLPAANADAARLDLAGHPAHVVAVTQRAPDDPLSGALGYAVRVGAFASQSAAMDEQRKVVALGFSGTSVDFTGEDGDATTGPWAVDVLRIDRSRFTGTLKNVLAGSTISAGKDTVSHIAARSGALAATNGGYFVVGPNDGTPGDPAGISIVDGTLVAEAVNGRTALFLEPHRDRGDRLASVLSGVRTDLRVAAADGAHHVVDGLDRVPGLIRACGRPGARPTEAPKHDFTCTDPDELIGYKAAFGASTPAGPGQEAVLDARGRVSALRLRGGSIPTTGMVLAGTGTSADWLAAHAQPGTRLRYREVVTAGEDRLDLESGLGAVNGGPRLLSHGDPAIDACAEGFCYAETGRFYWRFGVRRNPRTLAGVTARGDLLLVAVDGHEPGHSMGLSFTESASVLRALGASEALNLDGGGSTTLTRGARVVNIPSDATGERPVGDALLVLANSFTRNVDSSDDTQVVRDACQTCDESAAIR